MIKSYGSDYEALSHHFFYNEGDTYCYGVGCHNIEISEVERMIKLLI